MAVSLAGDPVGETGRSAGMLRRRAAREAGHGEVERTPPEMHRAGLAGESRAESTEGREHRRERLAEALGGVAIVLAPRIILGEGNGIFDLARRAVEGRRQAVQLKDV